MDDDAVTLFTGGGGGGIITTSSSLSLSNLKSLVPNVPEPRFWARPLIEFLLFQGCLALFAKARARRCFSVDAVPPKCKAFVKVKADLAEEVAALVQEATAREAAGA